MKQLELNSIFGLINDIKMGNGVAVTSFEGKPVKARSRVMYVAGLGNAIASNNNQLLLPSTTRKNGENNFDKGNVLNAGRNLIVLGLRMRFDSTTSSVTPLIATWLDDAPVAFKNGEIVFSQDGTGTLLELPMSTIVKYGAALPTEAEFKTIIPFMLREQAPFNIQALLAGSAGSTVAWRLELDVIELTDAANS